MIKHVIMWKFREGQKEAMEEFLTRLKALNGVIPQIVSMEVGVSCNPDNNFDAVLISTYDSMEDMKAYQNDPRHVEVSQLCKAIRTERAAVDFLIET